MTTPEPLDAGRLRARVVESGPFARLDVVTVTGSTNTDLVEAAHGDAPDRTVLIAEEQLSGRGRMRRGWVSPRAHGLHLSALLRPSSVPPAAMAWLPLITGVAVAETVRRTTGLTAALKWPNDVLLGGKPDWYKAAGILADGVPTADGVAVVVGIGVNVHHRGDQLPQGAGGLPATSLVEAGAADVDRERFAGDLLLALAEVDQLWRDHAGDVVSSGLLDRYQTLCGTLGHRVRVQFPENSELRGTATDIDPGGRLLVRGADGAVTPVSAGDVVHLRPS